MRAAAATTAPTATAIAHTETPQSVPHIGAQGSQGLTQGAEQGADCWQGGAAQVGGG